MVFVGAIGGEPGVGKSTVMREMINTWKAGQYVTRFKYGLNEGLRIGSRRVLGIYDGSLTPGTDKLSMALQPAALNYIELINNLPEDSEFWFEGDRLFTMTFFDRLRQKGIKHQIYVLQAPAAIVDARLGARAQSPMFRQGRRTKVENVAKANVCNIIDTSNLAPGAIAAKIIEDFSRLTLAYRKALS